MLSDAVSSYRQAAALFFYSFCSWIQQHRLTWDHPHSTHGETDKPAAIRLINWEPRSITCSSTKSRVLLKTCVIKVILNLTGAAGRSFHWDITTNKASNNTGASRKRSHFTGWYNNPVSINHTSVVFMTSFKSAEINQISGVCSCLATANLHVYLQVFICRAECRLTERGLFYRLSKKGLAKRKS